MRRDIPSENIVADRTQIALALALVTTGCSFWFVQQSTPSSTTGERSRPNCTVSAAAPVVDTILTIAATAFAVAEINNMTQTNTNYGNCADNEVVGDLGCAERQLHLPINDNYISPSSARVLTR
jgi:hypothetical protein